MLYKFTYRDEFDVENYSECIECANEVEATEVAHQLPAIILERYDNVQTRSELFGPPSDQHTKIIVTANEHLQGILTYELTENTLPRTAADIHREWCNTLGVTHCYPNE